MSDLKDVKDAHLLITPHDMFSYLIPGSTLIILVYHFEFWCSEMLPATSAGQFNSPIYTAAVLAAGPSTWTFMILFLFAVTVISYVLGHIIASISVLFIDRMLVRKGHGYPYRTLLKMPFDSGLKPDLSSPFYKGIFLWLNLYLIFRYCSIIADRPWLAFTTTALGWFLVFVLTMKLVISPVTLRHFPLPTKFFWRLFVAPYDLVGRMISRFSQTGSPFSEDFIERFERCFKANFNVAPRRAGTGVFWLPSIYIRDRSRVLSRDLSHLYNLYTFSRNLAVAFYLSFLYCFISILTQKRLILSLPGHDLTIITYLPLAFLIVAFILLGRYYYLHVGRHSRLLYRSFIYVAETPRPEAQAK